MHWLRYTLNSCWSRSVSSIPQHEQLIFACWPFSNLHISTHPAHIAQDPILLSVRRNYSSLVPSLLAIIASISCVPHWWKQQRKNNYAEKKHLLEPKRVKCDRYWQILTSSLSFLHRSANFHCSRAPFVSFKEESLACTISSFRRSKTLDCGFKEHTRSSRSVRILCFFSWLLLRWLW